MAAVRHWSVFAICVTIPIAVVSFLGTRETGRYRSEAKVLVHSAQVSSVPTVGEIQASRELALCCQDLVKTRSVLSRVIERLGRIDNYALHVTAAASCSAARK